MELWKSMWTLDVSDAGERTVRVRQPEADICVYFMTCQGGAVYCMAVKGG